MSKPEIGGERERKAQPGLVMFNEEIGLQHTKGQDISDHRPKLLLIEFDNAHILGVPVRSGTDANGRSPAHKPNNAILSLAPPLLDVDKKVLGYPEMGAKLGQLGVGLGQCFLRLVEIDHMLLLVPDPYIDSCIES